MNDMSSAIVPKSTQLNADDMIAGPMTISITSVSIKKGQEQPVEVDWSGGDGRPYLPCKSMCRALVICWGSDASKYIGRSMTLYRDPDVKWGGMAVGGIRISHLSHIAGEKTMMLTATKGSRKPHKILPLIIESDAAALQAALAAVAAMTDTESRKAAKALCAALNGPDRASAVESYNARAKELDQVSAELPGVGNV